MAEIENSVKDVTVSFVSYLNQEEVEEKNMEYAYPIELYQKLAIFARESSSGPELHDSMNY